jgi:hypothetical protein
MADEQNNTPQTAEEKYATPLPKQVREQMAALEQMMQPPDDQQQDDQDGQQQPERQQLEGQQQQPEQRQPPPDDDDQPELPLDDWKQRALSAQGRLDQALTANQQMARRLSELETQMSTLKMRGSEPQQPAQPQAQPPQKPQLIKPDELNDYGEEFFDVVGRRAREEFSPVFDELAQRLKRLESGQQAVGKVVEKTQKRGLYEHLADVVPDWREINYDPGFINWLSIPDPYSGRQRHEMLHEAFSRHDANRVVNFFQGFLTEAAGTPPTPRGQPGPSAPPLAAPNGNGNGSGKPSLESFAAPGRARSAPQELPPDKPVYTHAWIAKFMADKRTGKYRGREADADAIERDIFQAQHEGRIQ